MTTIRFDGQVAIVTGAGGGLGKSHALELARRGARVLVNDLGGALDGTGESEDPAQTTCAAIEALGGQACAHSANVCEPEEVSDMVETAMQKWGRVDVLINNAGILRDKSFGKMSLADFRAVLEVHLMGAVICTQAVWSIMRDQNYGRIVMTTSSSGLYGNFGQSNYGAAKMGLVGLMNTLGLEGAKNNVRVNALAPIAATRMTDTIPGIEAVRPLLSVESVTAALIYLASEDAPDRLILCAGAGGYSASRIFETQGVQLKPEEQTAENIAARWEQIVDASEQQMYSEGMGQTMKFVERAMNLGSKD